MSKKKTILITGCSSGIGLETAILCAKRGHKVVATMRNLDKAEPLQEKANTKHVKLSIKQCDVNNQASVDNCINETINEFGQIDVLINNAGYGLISPLETIKIEEAEAQFQTNFFGVIRMIQAVMPIMRKQKMGKIINVSSIAGIEGNALFGVYSATKFALEGLSESLAQEVKRYGIQVKLIEPGPVDTSFGRETNLKTGTRLEQMTPEYKRM
ncbi:MAG: SDR family oxidoreductase, partial [Candidatus Margulisbacteria bacterium]|nr:SDR family oxidoreductase [Candidatus Margulisiibacteriota bacterium]